MRRRLGRAAWGARVELETLKRQSLQALRRTLQVDEGREGAGRQTSAGDSGFQTRGAGRLGCPSHARV